MPSVRIEVDRDLWLKWKVAAASQGTTMRALVIDLLKVELEPLAEARVRAEIPWESDSRGPGIISASKHTPEELTDTTYTPERFVDDDEL